MRCDARIDQRRIGLLENTEQREAGLGRDDVLALTAADSTTFLATCFAIVLMFVAGERLVIVPLERRFARR